MLPYLWELVNCAHAPHAPRASAQCQNRERWLLRRMEIHFCFCWITWHTNNELRLRPAHRWTTNGRGPQFLQPEHSPFSLPKIANSSIFDGLSRPAGTLSGPRDYRGREPRNVACRGPKSQLAPIGLHVTVPS